MDLLEAATKLAEIVNHPDATYEDAMDAAGVVLSASDAAPDQANGALRILLGAVCAADEERAGIGAIVCGALVEKGADATLATEHIVERFVEVTKTSARYVAQCRDYFQEHILSPDAVCEICGPGEDETDVMMPKVRAAVSAVFPEGEAAWIALDLFCRPTVSVLARDPAQRRVLAEDVDFVNLVGTLSVHQPGAYFVWALLSMLDDESLIVIDPNLSTGWEVRMDGVADNFQFHLLLADALIGGGLVEGEAPEPHVVDVVSGAGPPLLDEHVMGTWSLYNWTALAPDGTVPDGYFNQGSQHAIWNDGVPADIRPIRGRRVVLLGPSPVIRQWRPARLFAPISAHLEVLRELPAAELEEWTNTIHIESAKARQPALTDQA